MPSFDDLAGQYADEIGSAAQKDRAAESRGEMTDATSIASGHVVAALLSVSQQIEDITYGDTHEPLPVED